MFLRHYQRFIVAVVVVVRNRIASDDAKRAWLSDGVLVMMYRADDELRVWYFFHRWNEVRVRLAVWAILTYRVLMVVLTTMFE
jgi:hypothetical protein